MRLSPLLRTGILALVGCSLLLVAHAAGPVKKFELIVAPTAQVGEALDVTVRALDADGLVKADYTGTIDIYSINDGQARLPTEVRDAGYQFTAADQGKKTFSKGLSFSKAGTMKIEVGDYDDDSILGSASVNVTAPATATTSAEVTIVTPDNGSTLSTSSTNVSGVTRKNSSVEILVNGQSKAKVQSDDTGSFLFSAIALPLETNTLQVQVYDGANTIIGKSAITTIKVDSSGPVFTSLTLSGSPAKAGSIVTATLMADSGMQKAELALMSGALKQVFTESKLTPGTYTASFAAPEAPGSYPVDVVLSSILGKTTTRAGAAQLQILPPEAPEFSAVKVVTAGDKVTFTFGLKNAPQDLSAFKIIGTRGSGATVTSTTYPVAKILSGSTYTWYIGALEPDTYAFTIEGIDAKGENIQGVSSEALEATVSLAAATQKCSIGNVTGVKFDTREGKTVITWDSIAEASTYQVYRKSEGKYTLIETLSMPSYTIYLEPGSIVYEDFAIKATCGQEENISPDYTDVTRVQTGPGAVIVIILGMLSVLGASYAMRART